MEFGNPRSIRLQFGFVAIPLFVFDICKKDSAAFHLYAVLSKYANANDRAWPGQGRIGEDMGASVRTVTRLMGVLKGLGLVSTEPHRNRNGLITGTGYVLHNHTPNMAHGLLQDKSGVVTTPKPVRAYKEELDPLTRSSTSGDPQEVQSPEPGKVYRGGVSPKPKKAGRPIDPERVPVFTGEHFEILPRHHRKFEERLKVAKVDDVDLLVWYREKDLELRTVVCVSGPILWLHKQMDDALASGDE